MGLCHCKVSVEPNTTNNSRNNQTSRLAPILIDEFGFLCRNNCLPIEQLSLETQLHSVDLPSWRRVLTSPDSVADFQLHVSSTNTFLHKGIPSDIRQDAWLKLSGALHLKKESSKPYQEYVDSADSATINQVAVDVPRTFSTHAFFRSNGIGRQRLIRLLYGISARMGPEIGYVQGMNMVAAVLLFVIDNEEDAFWVLVAFMERLDMKAMYADGLRLLTNNLNQLGQLISSRLPELRTHFGEENIEPFCYATPWFLTMFAYNLPVRQVVRIYDVAFCLQIGRDLIHRFALVFLESIINELLQSTFAGSTTLLKNILLTDSQLQALLQKALEIEMEGSNVEKVEEAEGGEKIKKDMSNIGAKNEDSQDWTLVPGSAHRSTAEAYKTTQTTISPH